MILRLDLYVRQLENSRYLCIRKPLKDWHLKQHLAGELTLGAYVLSPENRTRFIVIDADDNPELVTLTFRANKLAEDVGVFLAMVIPNELDQAGLAKNMEYDKLCRFSGVVPPMTEMIFRSM